MLKIELIINLKKIQNTLHYKYMTINDTANSTGSMKMS